MFFCGSSDHTDPRQANKKVILIKMGHKLGLNMPIKNQQESPWISQIRLLLLVQIWFDQLKLNGKWNLVESCNFVQGL